MSLSLTLARGVDGPNVVWVSGLVSVVSCELVWVFSLPFLHGPRLELPPTHKAPQPQLLRIAERMAFNGP